MYIYIYIYYYYYHYYYYHVSLAALLVAAPIDSSFTLYRCFV